MNTWILFCWAALQAVAGPSAEEIVARATENNAFGFANAVASVTLTLKRPDGRERVRQLEIRSRTGSAGLRTRVRFLAPAEVAGTGFLVLEKKGGDDEQYLYLPALGKTKRITGRQRDEKFMGTDLTYADIQAKDMRNSSCERLDDGSGNLGGAAVYVVQAKPTDPQTSPYSRTVSWVHRDAGVTLKTEFYDRSGKLQKVLTVQRLEKQAGHWVAMQSQVQDLQGGSSTLMRVDRVQFDAPLTDADFTQQALAGG